MNRRTRRRSFLSPVTSTPAIALVLMLGSACGDSGPPSSQSTVTTASTVTVTSTASSSSTTTVASATTASTRPTTTSSGSATTVRPGCDPSGFSLAQKQSDPPTSGVAGLAGVRAGQQDCYERIVFDFKDVAPNYRITTASPPFSGTSDIPITVAGAAFIKVRFDGTHARQPEFGAYTGPSSITPGLPAIKEIRLIEDFEAVVIWVIGLDKERGFRVGALSNPTRIYVDVAT